jgi:hypothetical protein
MSRTTDDGRAGPPNAAATQNDALIARAAKRAGWAGAALESAANDLHDAHDDEGKAMTGVAEVVLDEAARVSRLAEDIESQTPSHGATPGCTTGLVEGGAPRWRR